MLFQHLACSGQLIGIDGERETHGVDGNVATLVRSGHPWQDVAFVKLVP